MQLVEDASKGLKWWSVRLWVAAIVFQGLEQALPLWSDMISEGTMGTISALLGTAGLVARFIKQEIKDGNV